ncbi:MAG TPA: formate/nitrite transporter family protein [Verrucomicrobiae bacterium]|nr:formate/nitrite transporter family protein [Verrucomicrobiae bacterium]
MAEVFGFDCYAPKEIAERVENVGVTKANLPLLSQVALGVLAGGFIGLGAMFFTLVVSDASLGFALARVLGGVAFSLGLILVVVAGAELFTGNNLLVMATVAGRIPASRFLQNMVVIYFANLIGALGLAGLVALSGYGQTSGSAVGKAALSMAVAKCALPFGEAFFKGVLCNILVCLAVWLAMAGRTVTDKVLAIVFPIAAFVACGFEHSVANMYFIPLGIFLREQGVASAAYLEALNWFGLARNLLPVTLGNLVGGAGMVGLVYWVIYRRNTSSSAKASPAP